MKEKHTNEQPLNLFDPMRLNLDTMPVIIMAELTHSQYRALLKALRPSNNTDIKQ